YDIKRTGENLPFSARLQSGMTGLLRDQGGQKPESALERVYHNAFVRRFGNWLTFALESIRVNAVNDFDFVTLGDQSARQRADIGRAATDVVGRVERGDHAEAHQGPLAQRSRLVSVSFAALLQLQSRARAMALRRSFASSL